jgi:fatty-acyl-CoA synthase
VSRHQSLRWTWSELDAEVDSVASGLLRLGIGKGDRVGIWAPNRAEWAVIQFATARIGAILVTINPAYRTSEVEYALNKVGCRLLVLAPRFKSSDYVAMLRELGPQRLPMLEHMVALGEETFAGFLPWDALRAAPDKAGWHRPIPCLTGTIRSTSSSPAAPPAFPRARR